MKNKSILTKNNKTTSTAEKLQPCHYDIQSQAAQVRIQTCVFVLLINISSLNFENMPPLHQAYEIMLVHVISEMYA